MRNTVITCLTPRLVCTCGTVRDFGTKIGLPPVGMESFCPGGDAPCGKIWRLCSIDTGRASWVWADFTDPKDEPDCADCVPALCPRHQPVTLANLTGIPLANLNLLARRALGVEAALAGLGLTWRARGTC
jgi:hypothetical protein